MQKRKFDELISYFNRKVAEMNIDQKYKMELLGMISAIGFAHEKELGTNLASLGTDCISRQKAIDRATKEHDFFRGAVTVSDKARRDELLNVMCWLGELPPIQPEIVRCKDCKHHWTHKCMDSIPIERCDLEQTFYDAEIDFCSLAERREVTT